MRLVSGLLAVLVMTTWCPSSSQAAEIRATPWKGQAYYAWIVFLSEGPITWRETSPKTPKDEKRSVGHAYRLVHLVFEIYDTVLIEEVTLGGEGCCKKVKSVRKVDLDAFAKAFGMTGEISGFEFLNWGGDDSFRFRFKDREFSASGIGKSPLTISELSAPNSSW